MSCGQEAILVDVLDSSPPSRPCACWLVGKKVAYMFLHEKEVVKRTARLRSKAPMTDRPRCLRACACAGP